MSKISTDNNRKSWVVVSLLALAMPLAIYLVIDFLYAGKESGVQIRGVLSSILVAISLIGLFASAAAVYNLKGTIRLVPIVGIVVLVIVLCVSLLAATLSTFAGNY